MGKSGSKLKRKKRQRTASLSNFQSGSQQPEASGFARHSQLSRSCQDLVSNRSSQQQLTPEQQQQHQPREGLLRALFSFEGQVDGDLTFEKGDLLEVQDASDRYWLLARNLRTKLSGYVPYNYVQVYDGGPASLECWFDLDRRESERILLLPGHPVGCYLLRPCHQAADQAQLTLSVRSELMDARARRVFVKHYMVRQSRSGYYINPKQMFPDVESLLKYYHKRQDGLCCRLESPCPRKWQPPTQLRDFEISRHSLTMLRVLGQGSFGEVWQARLNRLVEVAVKSMKPGMMCKEEFLAEAKLHHRLYHPRVLQLIGVCTTEEPFYIITEFMQNGALSAYLRRDRSRRAITFTDMTDMMYQVADGMAYLAKNGIVHRDLRAANILVGMQNAVKVSDFGLSKSQHEEQGAEMQVKFPVRWTAPEAAMEKKFTTKSDVWSFGILMFEIVSRGEMPYKNLSNKEVIPKVSEGHRLANPATNGEGQCDDYLYDVMLHCWHEEPKERPSFELLRSIFEGYGESSEEFETVSRRASQFSLASAATAASAAATS